MKSKGREVKIEVDHVEGIHAWEKLISMIEDELLCIGEPNKLQPLCKECHAEKTAKEIEKNGI